MIAKTPIVNYSGLLTLENEETSNRIGGWKKVMKELPKKRRGLMRSGVYRHISLKPMKK